MSFLYKAESILLTVLNREGEEVSLARSSSSNRHLDSEPGRIEKFAETPVKALQDIASKCRTKVY